MLCLHMLLSFLAVTVIIDENFYLILIRVFIVRKTYFTVRDPYSTINFREHSYFFHILIYVTLSIVYCRVETQFSINCSRQQENNCKRDKLVQRLLCNFLYFSYTIPRTNNFCKSN